MKKTWKEKTKKEKIRTVLTICQRICAGIAAGIIILCFAFVGFKRCNGNKSMVKLVYAEEASVTALNDSTTNFFKNIWLEKTASFTPYCKPGWAILNGLPDLISGQGQIFPYNSLPQTMDGSYYIINETIENPLSLENSGYNLLCISGAQNLMDSNSSFALIAVIDTLEDNTQITTWIALSLQTRTSNSYYYSYYANAYRWTESGTVTDVQFQAKYSGGYGGVQANQSNINNSFTVGTSIGQNTFSYIKLPTQANLKTRQIKAKYRLDYNIRFFDYSLYGGDALTSQLATKIQENTTNNFYAISSIYNGTGGGGTSGVTQEEYNQLNQKYNTALNENILLQNQLAAAQNQLTAAQTNYNNLLYNEIPNLRTEIQNLEQQITALTTINNTLNEDIETLENEKADLQIQLSNKETELQQKINVINLLDGTITDLNNTINQLETDLNQEGNRWQQGYNTGYNKGVDDTKAINKALNFIPDWAVSIWNNGITKILMFDIYGFQIGEILIGLTTIIVALTITVNVLKG